ncbi:MAG: heat-inducible transcription repressor HrcA [Elusimicrobia bacterium RIFCSPLOWO2_01_FULL_60_11]|nr:MAG: heat-inducible transcription repressor HrcA [Elusimicrobia bacterium RIFCSPLOWO2_01_FULL_60_11]
MRALEHDEQEHRKKKVLQTVVHEYVRSGKPVGSNAIVTTGRLGLSSATVRNILSELEKEDLITHPHTSAGRVPTDKGYRLYVDSLIELQRLAVQEEQKIRKEYESRTQEIEVLMSQTSKMLSSLSHYTGFVMSPKLEKNKFAHMELVPLGERKILAAMVTESGLTKHFILRPDAEIPREQLRGISRIMNESFQGSTLQEVQLNMTERLEQAREQYKNISSLAQEIGQEIGRLSASDLYVEGTSNILSLPDFSKTEEIHDFFKLIEEKEMLAKVFERELLDNSAESFPAGTHLKESKRVHVRIGSENTAKGLKNLSLVSSTYQLPDRTVGVLGILGPKRMEYSKMMALVNYVSQTMGRFLKEFEKI